jgi:succinylglutamate desuccinylase
MAPGQAAAEVRCHQTPNRSTTEHVGFVFDLHQSGLVFGTPKFFNAEQTESYYRLKLITQLYQAVSIFDC